MSNKSKPFRHYVIVLLVLSLLQTLFPTYAQKQRPVVVSADQPNIWTLEQAHYLLAQMHRRNLDLKAGGLGELDPNEINGINIDALRTLLEVSAEFDEAAGINNRLRKDQKETDSARRSSLLERRTRLQDESLTLTRQIAELRIKKIRASNDEEKAQIQAQIDELEIVKSAVGEQIVQINNELETVGGVSGDFERTKPSGSFDRSKFGGTLDSAFSSAVSKVVDSFNNRPQLNASLRLENYLQMQYEILSKQLTLLRDEVGPGERLLFLEMPQSINAAFDKSDKKWAQSWWKLRAYTTCRAKTSVFDGLPKVLRQTARELKDLADELNGLASAVGGLVKTVPTPTQTPLKSQSKRIRNPLPITDGSNVELENRRVQEYKTRIVELAKLLAEDSMRAGDLISEIDSAIAAAETNQDIDQNVKQTIIDEIRNQTENFLTKAETRRGEVDGLLDSASTDLGRDNANATFILTTKLRAEGLKQLDEALFEGRIAWFVSKEPAFEDQAKMQNQLKTWLPDREESVYARLKTALVLRRAKRKNQKSCVDVAPSYKTTAETLNAIFNGTGGARGSGFEVGLVDLDKSPTDTNPSLEPKYDKSVASFLSEQSQQTQKSKENIEPEQQLPLKFDRREARIIDLFPRQSSLNVNDLKLRSSQFSLRAVFSWITGFGASANYQRQRERYSQFVQQELYASAFGKGSREFGWTFNPMPGTKRLMSGVRTTYAIVIVPEEATSLILESLGCYYKRSEGQLADFENARQFHEDDRTVGKGGCDEAKMFIVPIQSQTSGDNVFWVSEISYRPAANDGRVVVSIEGRDFSSQIGVLVDGVSLEPSIGIGQPFIVDDSQARRSFNNTANVRGSFERVGPNQIVATFEMGKDYKGGTPTLTLVAPGKAVVLNQLSRIRVNGKWPSDLVESDYMFGKRAGNNRDATKIDKVGVFRDEFEGLRITVSGENLGTGKVTGVDVNGTEIEACSSIVTQNCFTSSVNFIRILYSKPLDPKISVTLLTAASGAISAPSVDNPYAAKDDKDDFVLNSEWLRIDRAIYVGEKQIAGVLSNVYLLYGAGFSKDLKREATVILDPQSESKATLAIPKELVPFSLVLTDEKRRLKAVYMLKPKPERRLSDQP